MLIILVLALSSCGNKFKSPHGNIGRAEELQKQIKETEDLSNTEFPEPQANITQLEMEINNGGFNQYFFNSSGQNCFKTLEALELRGDQHSIRLAQLLEKAIEVVNTEDLSNEDFIEKIRMRELESLENDSINQILDSLDNVYYRN